MKRVLVFGMTDNPGGMESTIMNYYRFIDKKKFQFDFLCNTEKIVYENEIKKMGGKIYRIVARSKNIRLYRRDMDDFFKKHASEYDAIWVNVCSLANIDYLIYAKKYGIKKRIIHCHNSKNMDSWKRGILHKTNKRRVEKYATDFWSCSNSASSWFYSRKIVQGKNYRVIYNAVNPNEFKFNRAVRDEYRRKFGVGTEDVVIGNVGRLHFQKNQRFLLEMFKQLVEKDKRAKLWLVGEGPDRQELEKLSKKIGISGKTRFLGAREDVPELLQAMDIFIFPSVFEGFGTALVEAQYAGLMVYASKDVIPTEVKISDRLRFLSLEDGVEKWADIVYNGLKLKLLSDRVGVRFTSTNYDISRQVKKMELALE